MWCILTSEQILQMGHLTFVSLTLTRDIQVQMEGSLGLKWGTDFRGQV